jgi:hypothetical protein
VTGLETTLQRIGSRPIQNAAPVHASIAHH